MKVIRAVKQDLKEKNKCFECVFSRLSMCYAIIEAMTEAGLPNCNVGYIYATEEVQDE